MFDLLDQYPRMNMMAIHSYIKREVSLPKGQQVEDVAVEQVMELLGDQLIQRDMLIEALHLL